MPPMTRHDVFWAQVRFLMFGPSLSPESKLPKQGRHFGGVQSVSNQSLSLCVRLTLFDFMLSLTQTTRAWIWLPRREGFWGNQKLRSNVRGQTSDFWPCVLLNQNPGSALGVHLIAKLTEKMNLNSLIVFWVTLTQSWIWTWSRTLLWINWIWIKREPLFSSKRIKFKWGPKKQNVLPIPDLYF